MRSKGIGAHSFYIPTYNFTYYKEHVGAKKEDYPVAEEAFRRIVILPLFPTMTEKDADHVIECVKQALQER